MSHRKTTEEFIQKAQSIHGDKYRYSEAVYVSAHNSIIITCKKHGSFEQQAYKHLDGRGCSKCRYDKVGLARKSNRDRFIASAISVHGNKYSYAEVDYKGSKIKVKISCPVHGTFNQIPNSHLTGRGCPSCGKHETGRKETKTLHSFITQALAIHGHHYSYLSVDYQGAYSKVLIRCDKHGDFKQRPHDHLNGHGCPKCRRSIGESRVVRALERLHIEYKEQYRDPRCRARTTLPFDFAIMHKGEVVAFIEYQGIQHYTEWKSFRGEPLSVRKERDSIKQQFCLKFGVPLLIIPYWESGTITSKLQSFMARIIKLGSPDVQVE